MEPIYSDWNALTVSNPESTNPEIPNLILVYSKQRIPVIPTIIGRVQELARYIQTAPSGFVPTLPVVTWWFNGGSVPKYRVTAEASTAPIMSRARITRNLFLNSKPISHQPNEYSSNYFIE